MVDGINAVDKRYIYQLMSKVQLTGSVRFDSHIKIQMRVVKILRTFYIEYEGYFLLHKYQVLS